MTDKKPSKKNDLTCPECNRKALYKRKDGSVRCGRCGYESQGK